MDALDVLLNRVSIARLVEPAPRAEQLDTLFAAAMRAPDHKQLRPWRFLTIQGEARQQLGELFVSALLARNPQAAPEAVTKARAMPLRAPLLVVAIACAQEHPKVPVQEQVLAAGCAVHGMLLAAYAMGLGAIWRSGDLVHDPVVMSGLGIADHEEIIGFVYLGTPEIAPRKPSAVDLSRFVTAWPA
ncbi:nitroreductase [Pseudomonas duriflava]|uniref:Putative NAD(P)H nitroreductase n=1 Tax=Pseudomonas duriflava TaxID=459528 RepID=A0A562Q2T8_9PSED|nr:NAD(P)H nitroreductase [Pseudomonas duriflava]TWI51001.1 nitroreductase [Pseudomonas duriflava]